MQQSFIQFIMYRSFYMFRHYVVIFKEIATHHITKHNMPIHNILSTAPQLSISQKALGTLLEDGNVMPKHEGATTHNKLNK
jgi:hypothetical protein